jgi:phage/plasmid-associated DNA primase
MRLIGSGDGLTLRDLYSSSATYEFKLKFIAACNKPPRLETAQDAYFNR